MEPITQTQSIARPLRHGTLVSYVVLSFASNAAFALEPVAVPAPSTASLASTQVTAVHAAEIANASTVSEKRNQPTNGPSGKHDEVIELPKPGVPLTLLAVLLLMGIIGKRR